MTGQNPLSEKPPISIKQIAQAVLVLRGQKTMLDSTLAELYEGNLKALNQAVKRNLSRFPADFMFQLNAEEAVPLRSQIVTLEGGRGTYRKYLPYRVCRKRLSKKPYRVSDRALVPPNPRLCLLRLGVTCFDFINS